MVVVDDHDVLLQPLRGRRRRPPGARVRADVRHRQPATSTTPKVQYDYANGSANTIRPTTLTYPNGRVITYDYGSANSIADAASRIVSILDDDVSSTHLADYSYLGLGTFVEVDYTEPEIKYTLVGTAGGDDPDTGDIYRGFDRIGWVKDSYWYNYGSSTEIDRIKYGYDRNGNRTYRENTVATANNASFDEKYFGDLLDRLKQMDRGQLTPQKDAVTNKTFAQCWTLDATGNWRKFLEDSDGDGAWSLDQTRTANNVNEITDLTESIGPSWMTPAYSRAGNMTTFPKPADPTVAYTGTYDAWNRLVRIEEGTSKVAEYEYDGAKRRTVKKAYVSGILDGTRHFYFSTKWQVVEERVGSSTDPERQYAWGLRYVDDLVVRDRDSTANGTLDERLYSQQDSNWNVSAISDVGGIVLERYAYTAYGAVAFLDSSFNAQLSSLYDIEYTYTGRRFDYETGLFCFRNRQYAAHLGVFVSRDPSKYFDSASMYVYARSRPHDTTDPLGLWVQNNCTFQCEQTCATQYPNWWQWPQYAGCIQGCNLGCQGQEVTFCNYVNNWPQCYKDGLRCVCAGISFVDILPNLPGDPYTSAVIGGLDCACGIVNLIQMNCGGAGPGSLRDFFTVLAADCGLDLIEAVAGGDLGIGWWESAIELLLSYLEETINVRGAGGLWFFEACSDWWCNCR